MVSDYAERHIKQIENLVHNDQYKNRVDFAGELNVLPSMSFHQSAYALREFRHYHFIRLLLKEYGKLSSTYETLMEWSHCADAIINYAFNRCITEQAARFGAPLDSEGKPTEMYVLAMGKLGGYELNFSSDIDLIITFSSAGFTNGSEIISNQEFYTKVVQQFLQLIQTNTEHGFVFRVDLRLRPNGDSGALVSSLAALEAYYQEQGRDWERYAMVKARVLNVQAGDISWFKRLIVPFTYRRYIDFSVIDSLRSMKALIEQEVRLNPHLNDIKRGLGGIREIEFIIQNIQLIRGGRLTRLRNQNALKALTIIKEEQLLTSISSLQRAYLFFRQLENCLQSLNDQQTHSLPDDPFKQSQIGYAMDFSSWPKLVKRLQQHQHQVRTIFQSILVKENHHSEHYLLNKQLISVWQGNIETSMAVNLLTSLGFQGAERCYELISTFRHTPRCRRLTQAARLRLDQFMGLLLAELAKITATECLLLNLIKLLETIVGRSAYLALLTENPHVIKELLFWFANCPFITELIIHHPFLLELLISSTAWRPPTRLALQQQLALLLQDVLEIEQQQYLMRQFKLSNWLLAAKSEIFGGVKAYRISQFLADVAEVIVAMTVQLACNELCGRYPNIHHLKNQFSIIAYGRLGSREMSYDSDLDLVFLYQGTDDEVDIITRLTQKIIHMLTSRLQSGILYAVDTRLRPSGSAGLLLSSFEAFKTYQLQMAWTWEHQALIRARLIIGNTPTKIKFNYLKQIVFTRRRVTSALVNDIEEMLRKLKQRQATNYLKYAPGGIIELDFLIQLLVLSYPNPNYSQYSSSLNLLSCLYKNKVIATDVFKQLKKTYFYYQRIQHIEVLRHEKMKWHSHQHAILIIKEKLLAPLLIR